MTLSILIAKFKFRQHPNESSFAKFNAHQSYPRQLSTVTLKTIEIMKASQPSGCKWWPGDR